MSERLTDARFQSDAREREEGCMEPQPQPECLALKHESRILGHSSNHVSGFSMVEQVRLSAVWPMENWLVASLNQIQSWTTVRESYSCALEQRPLVERKRKREKERGRGKTKTISVNLQHGPQKKKNDQINDTK